MLAAMDLQMVPLLQQQVEELLLMLSIGAQGLLLKQELA